MSILSINTLHTLDCNRARMRLAPRISPPPHIFKFESNFIYHMAYYVCKYPDTIFTIVSLTSFLRYSTGGSQSQARPLTISTHFRIDSGCIPERMLLPTSRVSGLSVTSRKVTFGTLNIQHSSCALCQNQSIQSWCSFPV